MKNKANLSPLRKINPSVKIKIEVIKIKKFFVFFSYPSRQIIQIILEKI